MFTGCSGAYTVINQGVQPSTVNAATIPPPSAQLRRHHLRGAQYWNAATQPQPSPAVTPTTSCPAGVTGGGPQLLTVSVHVQVSWRRHAAVSHDHDVLSTTRPRRRRRRLVARRRNWSGRRSPVTVMPGRLSSRSPTLEIEYAEWLRRAEQTPHAVTLSVASGPGPAEELRLRILVPGRQRSRAALSAPLRARTRSSPKTPTRRCLSHRSRVTRSRLIRASRSSWSLARNPAMAPVGPRSARNLWCSLRTTPAKSSRRQQHCNACHRAPTLVAEPCPVVPFRP